MTENHTVRYQIRKGNVTQDLLDWIQENELRLVKFTFINDINAYGRPCLVSLDFVFAEEEEAMAFKIRWGGK